MVMAAGAEGSGSDRREALGLLLGGAAAAAAVLGAPPPTRAAVVGSSTTTAVAKAKVPLPAYPAKVTSKCYLDVRITGFVTGEEKVGVVDGWGD